jgi:transposase
MGYSEDLRVRLIRSVEDGRSARSQAKVFLISASTAVKWMQAFRAEGRTASRPGSGGRASPLEAHAEWLIAQVTTTADVTLKELVHELAAQGIVTSKSAVSRFFLAKGYSFKKKRAGRGATAR